MTCSRGPVLFSSTGLRERLAALPFGRLREGRNKAGTRRVIRPSFNDLGGLRLISETRWLRRPPRGISVPVVLGSDSIGLTTDGQRENTDTPRRRVSALSGLSVGIDYPGRQERNRKAIAVPVKTFGIGLASGSGSVTETATDPAGHGSRSPVSVNIPLPGTPALLCSLQEIGGIPKAVPAGSQSYFSEEVRWPGFRKSRCFTRIPGCL